MKKLITFSICFLAFAAGYADHITGGQMSYTYVGGGNGTVTYSMEMKLYMRCNSGRQFNDPTVISVFNKSTSQRVMDIEVPLALQETISLTDPDPCISNPPVICYEVGYFRFNVTLPQSPDGYIVAGQVNFRISGIANLTNGYSQVGATYTTEIPGGTDNIKNYSANFTGSDLVVVCANNPFTYSFAASDFDGDDIRYHFCEAYKSSTGPVGGGGNMASPPGPPPYQPVPYGNGFSGEHPLGPNVTIDSETGLISGTAPAAGVYVVTVCAEEIRNGKVIAIQRKDLQIAITNCNLTAAILPPEYQLCRDTKTITLSNLSQSNLINSYFWEIKNKQGLTIFTSTAATPTFTYPDTGFYFTKLVVNPGERCTDSTTNFARVFPGFKPAFEYDGICFKKQTFFKDLSTSVYGRVNSWQWDFGEVAGQTDVSIDRNPVYTFTDKQLHVVTLTVTDSKGCIDTAQKNIALSDNPPVNLAFRDTLICPPDRLELKAAGRGIYSWTPAAQMINANTPNPFVSPLTTTTYYVNLDQDGCIGKDSVTVRVTTSVKLAVMKDSTVCTGDPAVLRATGNANVYNWSPASLVDNPQASAPVAQTPRTNTFTVVAGISQCTATGSVTITTIDYPLAFAGNDTLICFNSNAYLHGSTNADKFTWAPSNSLNSSNIPDPVASPKNTTGYVFKVFNNSGCTKAVSDTVLVTVLPDINVRVNNDTSIVLGQELQLTATGGDRYLWIPDQGLSASNIPNPVAIFDEAAESIRYTVIAFNAAGCTDSAYITLRIFGTQPSVFVPTGFTPNGDGKNDVLRPIAAGMKSIERFVVYNRYGQQVFFTKTNGDGWDGRINGQPQQTGTYVWMVQATDYNGKKYMQKGTATLVR
jgi:gliding motility-associated-like protein